MKTINYGKINDAQVFAVLNNGKLSPMTKEDLKFESADYLINCDSGSYPGVSDVDQYICDQVVLNKML